MVTSRRAFAIAAALGAFAAVATGANGTGASPAPEYRFSARTSGTLSGRIFTAAAGAADGSSVVVYGGGTADDSNTTFGDTWEYEPATGWVAKCGSTSAGATHACGPGPRSAAGMATGPSGPVLFGGSPTGIDGGGGSLPSDTWTWNGDAWTQVCTSSACGPGGRLFPGLGGNGHQIVLFGGLGPSGLSDDTWVFDGHGWTQTCGTAVGVACNAPGAVAPTIGWDGHEFVMFGGAPMGASDIGAPTDDTWTFDGTAWTHVCGTSVGHACGPPARALAALAFQRAGDATLQGAVLAGGGSLFGSGTQDLDRDVWRYQAGAWSQLPTPWPSSAVSFTNGGQPPTDSGPLLPVVASRPVDCQIVFVGENPVQDPGFSVAPQTYAGGWDLSGRGQPSVCEADPATTPTSTPVGATATPASVSGTGALPATGAGSPATTATMARTGRSSTRLAGIGALAVLLGLAAIAMAREPGGRSPSYSGSTGSR